MLRRVFRLRVSEVALRMLEAQCRTVAMLAGPYPVRDRALSVPKVTSGTRWRLFLIAQWLRTAPARVCGVIGLDAT